MDHITSEAHVLALKAAFSVFDKDGDGSITIDEVGHVMASIGMACTEHELRAMMNEIDADGNGSIDLNEFLVNMSRTMKIVENEEEIRDAFRVFDGRACGEICARDVRAVAAKIGVNLEDREIEAMLRAADVDGDGKVNYDDFLSMMTTIKNDSSNGQKSLRHEIEDENIEIFL